MTADTYERTQEKGVKKETFEWITSWSDYARNTDKPRVLLIGDSIVRAYQEIVRKELREECYVDYISTSYALDNPFYKKLLLEMAKNAHYDLILYNFGLHGGHICARSYRAGYAKMVDALAKLAPVIPMTTTTVYRHSMNKLDPVWKKKCAARNAAVFAIAEERKLPVCDLFAVCADIPYGMRTADGYHFTEDGSKKLAEAVLHTIRETFKK